MRQYMGLAEGLANLLMMLPTPGNSCPGWCGSPKLPNWSTLSMSESVHVGLRVVSASEGPHRAGTAG